MNKERRIYQIDLFRFIAALSVLLYHYLYRGYAADKMSTLNLAEIGGYFKYGYLGVDIFFIISGFVISLSIGKGSIFAFIKSRITRLYPAYWVCLILTFTVVYFFGAPRYYATLNEFFVNFSMLQGYVGVKDIDGAYWSLLVELKFYMIIGAYLILIKLKSFSLDKLAYIWLILTLLHIFYSEFYLMNIANNYLIFRWSAYFIAGIFFHETYKNNQTTKYLLPLFVCLVTSIYLSILDLKPISSHFNSSFSPYVNGSIITVFFVVMFLVSIGKLNLINSSKLLKLGVLTYPLYLIHQQIGFIIFNNVGDQINRYVLFLSTACLMLFFAFFINKYIEVPVSKFLKSVMDKISLRIVGH